MATIPGLKRLKRALKTLLLPPIARSVRDQKLTYLSVDKLYSLMRAAREVEAAGVTGTFLEFGVALGGSAICLATLAGKRGFAGYDVFGMIPPPSAMDSADSHERFAAIKSGDAAGIEGDAYYGYDAALYDKVVAAMSRNGVTVDGKRVRLIKGLFEDTVRFTSGDKIAFAHIDCDWFEPVAFCLDAILPHLSPGGIIICDDYNDFEGCRRAVDNFLAKNPTMRMRIARPHAVLVKSG